MLRQVSRCRAARDGRLCAMDLDAFERARADRLGAARRAACRLRRRSGAEADELVRLYQSVATDLSSVRSAAPGPRDGRPGCRCSSGGRGPPSRARTSRAGATSPPSSSSRCPRPSTGSGGGRSAVTVAFLAARRDRGRLGGDAARRARVDGHAEPAAGVRRELVRGVLRRPARASRRWCGPTTRSSRPSASPPGSPGSGPCTSWPATRSASAPTGGMMAAHGHLDVFLQLIAPHGLLELTAVFVAGAAGLRIFWTWIDPGPRTRGRALAQEARALFTVAIGLVGRARGLGPDRGVRHGVDPAVGREDRASGWSRWRRSGRTRSCSVGVPCAAGAHR